MFNRFTLILSFLVILFIHLTLLANYKVKQEKLVVAAKPTVVPIALKKVTIKQKEIKKVEKKKVVKKVVKPKKIKKVKKIVKKAVRKIVKKQKKVVKKKIVKKEQVKLKQTITKKVTPKKVKKVVISDAKLKSIQNEYLQKVKEHIEKYKKYPKRAKRLKQEGKVFISFTIAKNGKIQDIQLVGKCPYKRLNKAALNILETIAQFEPIPKELNKSSWQLNVPIVYSIINI